MSDTDLIPARSEVNDLPPTPIHTPAALHPKRAGGSLSNFNCPATNRFYQSPIPACSVGLDDGLTYFQSQNTTIAIERGVKANIDVDGKKSLCCARLILSHSVAEGYAFVRLSTGTPQAAATSVCKGRKVIKKTRSVFSGTSPPNFKVEYDIATNDFNPVTGHARMVPHTRESSFFLDLSCFC